MYIIMMILIEYIRPNDVVLKTMVAVLGVMGLVKFADISIYWFESQVRSKYTVIVQNISFIAAAGMKLIVIASGGSIVLFALSTSIEALLASILLMFVYIRYGNNVKQLKFDFKYAGQLLKESWPLIIIGISTVMYMKIDQIMIGQIIGDRELGLYSIAARLSEIWYFIAVAINSSIRPGFLRERALSYDKFMVKIHKTFDLMVRLSVLMAIIVSVSAERVILMLMGSEYISSVDSLKIHIWAAMFVFLNNAAWIWYISENKQKIGSLKIVIGLIVNIALNYVLIPRYGIEGAAVATLVSRAVVGYFGLLLSPNSRELFVMMTYSIFTLGFGHLARAKVNETK